MSPAGSRPAPVAWLVCVALLASLSALALVGCRAVPSRSAAAFAATPPRSREDVVRLRSLGRHDEALAAARDRHAALLRDRGAPRWKRDDARREVVTLEKIVRLPAAERLAIARADAASADAESLRAIGDPFGAYQRVEAQLATRRRLFGPAHPEIASSLSALARLALWLGELRRAHDFDREALAMRRRLLGERHPDVAESLDQLAVDLKNAGGSRTESMRLYREALALRRELLGEGAPEVAGTLMNIANMHRLQRQPDSALAIFRHVLEERRSAHPPHPHGDVLFAMAMTVMPRGRFAEAEPWLRLAIAEQRTLGPGSLLPLARTLSAHGLALRHLGRFAAAESVMVESAQLFEMLRRKAPPGRGRAVMFPMITYEFLAPVQIERGRAAEAWVSMERALGRELLETLALRGSVDTTAWWDKALERLQRTLRPDQAVIGWLTSRVGAANEEYPFWCYVVRDRGPVRFRRVDAPHPGVHAASDVALDRMRSELLEAAAWPLRVTDDKALGTLARAAYEQRFAPIEPWLEGVRRLVVIAPDLMHGSPLEALVDREGRYLADRFAISYAPSALLFAAGEATRDRRPPPASWRALLVGDPAAGNATLAGPFHPLAAAQAEVREIAAIVPSSDVLLGAQASAERLHDLAAARALGRYQILHFATHSAVDPSWLGGSALVLSTPRGHGAREGRITADEIAATWTLDADLVTLAACQTITGPATKTDGYHGLHHALLGAGARHLLVSLWQVDDEATALLMSRFYRALFQKPAETPAREAEALAEARRWLRRWTAPGGGTPYAHPAYWAGFVLIDGGVGAAQRQASSVGGAAAGALAHFPRGGSSSRAISARSAVR